MTQRSEQAEHFWELPYGERRLVIFGGLNSTIEIRQSFGDWCRSVDLPNWEKDWPATPLFRYIKHVYSAIDENIILVPISWASDRVVPAGHPRTNFLYVAHPLKNEFYIPAGDFHRYAFEQKFSEAVRLLMHLGATTVQVHQKKGWGHEFAAHLSAPLPAAEANVKAGAEKKKRKTGVLLYDAELEGTDEPALPEDGLLWYPHEPTWQNVAEGRLKFGLKSFSLTIHYTDDYGVNAELAAKVADAGVEMGGNFNKHEETIWRITGAFG